MRLSLHSIVSADPSADQLGNGPADFTLTTGATDMNGLLYRLAGVEIRPDNRKESGSTRRTSSPIRWKIDDIVGAQNLHDSKPIPF
jgi:hypothetical protein